MLYASISTPHIRSVLLLLKCFIKIIILENEKIETDEDEIVLLNDVEVITDENDPEKVTVVKPERKCNTTSEGDKVIAKGKNILKKSVIDKERGQRSWFKL